MPTILVLNPNTTDSITQRVAGLCRPLWPRDWQVQCVTVDLGAAYLASSLAVTVAAYAALERAAQWIDQHGRPDALLLACFGDPGLDALREGLGLPVTGLAEASFFEAHELGPFGVLTGGTAWIPLLNTLAVSQGLSTNLVRVDAVQPTGAELAADPEGALKVLAAQCRSMVEQSSLQSIIIGGAGLAGYAKRLQDQVSVPLIDSVEAGARVLQQRLIDPQRFGSGCLESPAPVAWARLPKALRSVLELRGIVSAGT